MLFMKETMAASQGMLFTVARHLVLILIPNPTLNESKVEVKLYYYTISQPVSSAVSRCDGQRSP